MISVSSVKSSSQNKEVKHIEAGKVYSTTVNAVNLKNTEELFRFEFELSFAELDNKAVKRNVMLSRVEDVNAMLSVVIRYHKLDNDAATSIYESFDQDVEAGNYGDIAQWLATEFVGRTLIIKTKQNNANRALPYLNFAELKD